MPIPRRKSTFALESLFSPRSPWEFIGFCLATVLLSFFADLIEMALSPAIAYSLSLLFIVALFAVWWGLDRWRSHRQIKNLTFEVNKEPPAPARGLILLLSPYRPGRADLNHPEALAPPLQALLTADPSQLTPDDFDSINLHGSNLRPQIEAVRYHCQQGTLGEVWLLASQSDEGTKGSETTAQLLEQYLRCQYQNQLDIYRQALAAKDWDYSSFWQLGEGIFRRSVYKEKGLVVDITGGTKMMSIALAMSCVAPGRRMQYMDAQRDWQGNPLPEGQLSPVGIDIDPMLYPRGEG